jgi:anti-sigma factor RsiW
MTNIGLPQDFDHDDVQRLLPWYVTDTLNVDEAERVAAHLERCADCKAELAEERRLAAAVAALSIGSAQSALPTALRHPDRRVAAPRRRLSRYAALAAAQAAIILLTVGTVRTVDRHQPEYRALSSAPTARPGNILVMFGPEAHASQLREAMSGIGARIVDGPTTAGAYVLHVAEGRRDTALKTLRTSPGVMLAEPIEQSR